MKHLILISSLLMLFSPNTHAGWFFNDPPPDLGPEYRAKIIRLEDRIPEQTLPRERFGSKICVAFGNLVKSQITSTKKRFLHR
jgi:hypothetical protein